MKLKKADIIMSVLMALIIISGIIIALRFGESGAESIPMGKSFINASITEDVEGQFCFVEIRCDTILEHMEQLVPGKANYVPENEVIFDSPKVRFSEGETAFDVIKRICEELKIPLEYSYTPLYESYYIEGINHLYEFDCGNSSGWVYQVNEQFPNYGCSSYLVKENDKIIWYYTCRGFGRDVGADMEES